MISGSISIAADATVSANTLGSLVSSVARTATGAYTITLSSKYPKLQSIDCQLLAPVAVDLVPQVVSETVSTTKLIVVKLLAGATATDPSAVCTLYVNIILNASSV